MFACMCVTGGSVDAGELTALAREFSPRVETHDGPAVVLDVSGLGRLIGPPAAIGAELRQAAAARGLETRVALATTRVAARLLAGAREGLTIAPADREAGVLAPLPLDVLRCLVNAENAENASTQRSQSSQKTSFSAISALSALKLSATSAPSASPASSVASMLETFRRWGLRTLGDLAALPAPDLAARLGAAGVALHRAARGIDARPLVPDRETPRFLQTIDLEWPIEGLEPLSFVLARLVEPLSAALERADAGAAALVVRLRLVTRRRRRTSTLCPPGAMVGVRAADGR